MITDVDFPIIITGIDLIKIYKAWSSRINQLNAKKNKIYLILIMLKCL